jgi:Na+:H+ antiporter, NhaA family
MRHRTTVTRLLLGWDGMGWDKRRAGKEASRGHTALMRLSEAFIRFARSEQFGGVLLIACTVVSLLLANSALGSGYHAFWQMRLGPLSVEHWINDALMAIFFLLIGLELEREIYVGELSNRRGALLPVFAALGGMAAPALIHAFFNAGTPTALGFGIPMATDIAFALGILALLGPRVPPALKVFVVAFAVIDDLGAIALIAFVYSAGLSLPWLAAALGLWGALIALNRPLRVMSLWPYLLGGVVMWYCLLQAGVHASIAGVMLAFAIPFTARDAAAPSPSQRLMQWLHGPVAYLILPLFALANTGVILDSGSWRGLLDPNSLGITLGLVIGKPVGVLLFCTLAVRTGISMLPSEVRWRHMLGAGLIGGIGFTMSLFITNLAFASDPHHINDSKLGILTASLLSAVLGFLWLRSTPNERTQTK